MLATTRSADRWNFTVVSVIMMWRRKKDDPNPNSYPLSCGTDVRNTYLYLIHHQHTRHAPTARFCQLLKLLRLDCFFLLPKEILVPFRLL